MLFIKFFLVFLFSIAYASTYDSADVRFEIEKGLGKQLTIKAFEHSTSLFTQTVDSTFRSTLVFGKHVLSRHGEGYKILYRGKDETSLSLEIDAEGNIFVDGAHEQTGFNHRKSWGLKTPGIIRHTGASLFYQLFTHAKQFQNYGILKSYTGTFLQDYIFNQGIFHFGDETDYINSQAYLEHLAFVNPKAQPSYERGIIDDWGVILADKGLRISGLTHRSRGLVDIGEQGLEAQNAGIDNHGTMNITGPIKGHLHHFTNHNSIYADSMNRSSLTIDNWLNTGQVSLFRNADLFSQNSWNNTGRIIGSGNTSVGCRKKPTALGTVVSEGDIKAIIDEALDDAASNDIFANSAFVSKKNKIILNFTRHTDHYLNTITRHHTNGRYTHTTETGYQFQRRTTENSEKVIDSEEQFPEAAVEMQQSAQGKRNFLNAFKSSLKEKLKKLGLFHGSRNNILKSLMKGLRDAGLSSDDIEEIFGDDSVASNLLDLVASYDQLPSQGKQKLHSDLPDVSSYLNDIAYRAQRLSLPLWQWVERNGPEFVNGFCNLAIIASPFIPQAASVARVCTLGQLAPKAANNLENVVTFFNKKHGNDSTKGTNLGNQRITNPPKAESPIWRDLKPYKADIKTNGKTGSDKRLYQWDYLHNEIEMYDGSGKPIDALNPQTGERLFKDVRHHKPLKL